MSVAADREMESWHFSFDHYRPESGELPFWRGVAREKQMNSLMAVDNDSTGGFESRAQLPEESMVHSATIIEQQLVATPCP